MKQKTFVYLLFILLLTCTVFPRDEKNTFQDLQGPYLGQKAPVEKSEVFLDRVISTLEEPEMNAAFTQDGKEFYYCTLYKDKWAIFITREVNGKWTRPVPMGFTSNYTDRDFTMSPDESYIIFSSQNRSDTLGEQDLYISFRKKDKSWTNAKNMGPSVNSRSDEICPSVSLDGKYFFFTSRRRGYADIFWITTDVIEKLRKKVPGKIL